jgi:Ser/Thr protein kinase RdoA (MazF antagonist)
MSDVLYRHWVMAQIEGLPLSFHVPIPLLDRDGRSLHQRPNGEYWELIPSPAGEVIEQDNADASFAMGAALGELHQTLRYIEARQPPGFGSAVLPNLDHPMPYNPAELGLSDSKESYHRLRRFIIMAEQYRDELPEANLVHHLIHGNFIGENIRYNGEVVTAVVDFSQVHPNYRALEFVQVMLWITNDFGARFWATARLFAEGYATYLSLTQAEIDLVPRLMQLVHVDKVLAAAHDAPEQAAVALRGQEILSAWLEVEEQRINKMLCGVFLGV